MAIVRWDPIKDLMQMQDRMNKIFEGSNQHNSSYGSGEWVPPVDIYETEKEIILLSEVPGVCEQSIDVQVSDGMLTIKGDKSFPVEKGTDNYYRLERSYGKFYRSFALPNTIEKSTVTAVLKDGILKIVLQKSAEDKPKIIKVKKG